MQSRHVKVISRCAKSPWFAKTFSANAVYGEYAGRLVLLSLGGDREAEYWKLRREVGLFDVPERPLEIRGADAAEFLGRVFTRPVDRLRVGRGRYALLCHQGGGLVCDGIVFRLAADRFWYVHADADVYLWLVAHALDYRVEIVDPQSWVLQVQGPKSLQVLAAACDGGAPEAFNYFDCIEGSMGGQPVLISRTGWTNELGFEVYNLEAGVDGPALWDHLLAAGEEFGIAALSQLAMNIRRIEGGILNYPTDMNWHTTPFDLGLGRFVDLDGRDFIGRAALRQASRACRFSGFESAAPRLRYLAPVSAGGEVVGRITDYEWSPYLQHGVGYLRFDEARHMSAAGLAAADRDGREWPLKPVQLPFYDAEKNIPRGLPPVSGAID